MIRSAKDIILRDVKVESEGNNSGERASSRFHPDPGEERRKEGG